MGQFVSGFYRQTEDVVFLDFGVSLLIVVRLGLRLQTILVDSEVRPFVDSHERLLLSSCLLSAVVCSNCYVSLWLIQIIFPKQLSLYFSTCLMKYTQNTNTLWYVNEYIYM